MGVLSVPRPSHLTDASKASVPQQAPAPVPGFGSEPALQPISDSVGCSSHETRTIAHREMAMSQTEQGFVRSVQGPESQAARHPVKGCAALHSTVHVM
jgi:hypothetical protein